VKYLHISKQPHGVRGDGSTYNVGRNADKRARRLLWQQARAEQVKQARGIIARKTRMLP
jgi:hypothetical protein